MDQYGEFQSFNNDYLEHCIFELSVETFEPVIQLTYRKERAFETEVQITNRDQ